jgi:hypothetical protein
MAYSIVHTPVPVLSYLAERGKHPSLVDNTRFSVSRYVAMEQRLHWAKSQKSHPIDREGGSLSLVIQ